MSKKSFSSGMSAAETFLSITEDAPQYTTAADQQPQEPVQPVTQPIAEAVPAARRERKPPELRTKRVQLLMQPSLYEKLKARADYDYISVNEYINQLIEAAVKEDI